MHIIVGQAYFVRYQNKTYCYVANVPNTRYLCYELFVFDTLHRALCKHELYVKNVAFFDRIDYVRSSVVVKMVNGGLPVVFASVMLRLRRYLVIYQGACGEKLRRSRGVVRWGVSKLFSDETGLVLLCSL